jgi:hypothetical protein
MLVAHSYNPSYLGDWDPEGHRSRGKFGEIAQETPSSK